MKLNTPLLFAVLFFFSFCLSGVEIGDSYDSVIAELGNPDGNFEMGGTSILTYGEGKIKIKNEKVSWISPNFYLKRRAGEKRKSEIEQKRGEGLVSFRGKWISQEEKDRILAVERQRRQHRNRIDAAANASRIWMTDYKAALEKANREEKRVLLNFTGSDWCGWCIKLDREVFSTHEFMAYANQNLVLVKLDFPKKKKLPELLQAQNKGLAKRYRIRGYPTIIILNSRGKSVGKLGYTRGGPKAFIKEVEKL